MTLIGAMGPKGLILQKNDADLWNVFWACICDATLPQIKVFFHMFHTFPKCCGASVMNLLELCLCPSGAEFRPSSALFVVECGMVTEIIPANGCCF